MSSTSISNDVKLDSGKVLEATPIKPNITLWTVVGDPGDELNESEWTEFADKIVSRSRNRAAKSRAAWEAKRDAAREAWKKARGIPVVL